MFFTQGNFHCINLRYDSIEDWGFYAEFAFQLMFNIIIMAERHKMNSEIFKNIAEGESSKELSVNAFYYRNSLVTLAIQSRDFFVSQEWKEDIKERWHNWHKTCRRITMKFNDKRCRLDSRSTLVRVNYWLFDKAIEFTHLWNIWKSSL